MATVVVVNMADCAAHRVPLSSVARMSSRGPWYDPRVQANFMLAKRAAEDLRVPFLSVQWKLAEPLRPLLPTHPKDGSTRVPSSQRVRQWEKALPDFPERALTAGLIERSDLLAMVQPYLNGVGLRPRHSRLDGPVGRGCRRGRRAGRLF